MRLRPRLAAALLPWLLLFPFVAHAQSDSDLQPVLRNGRQVRDLIDSRALRLRT